MMTSQILRSMDFTKTQIRDKWKTKHYFFSNKKKSLMTHQGLIYSKK